MGARYLLLLAAWISASLPVALMLGRAIRTRDRDKVWVCTPIDLTPIVDQPVDHHARSRGSLGVEL